MEKHFLSDLEKLKMIILEMAALTERAVDKAAHALLERDVAKADEVIEGERQINLLDLEVDRFCLKMLALDQPFARDLRFIIGCMKIAVDLERSGDQAENVAQRAQFLSSRPPLPPNAAMENLIATAMEMLHNAITSFNNGDVNLARKVCQMDDVADGLNLAVLKSLLDFMVKETPAVERSVQTIIAARCLERIADQATNIAESVIFIVDGINIKHHYGESFRFNESRS
jgi:phosphate transport system protein